MPAVIYQCDYVRHGHVYNQLHSLTPFQIFSKMFTRASHTHTRRVVALISKAKSRSFVQPSVADRASVVDVPSTYQDDNLFTPRPGEPFCIVSFSSLVDLLVQIC